MTEVVDIPSGDDQEAADGAAHQDGPSTARTPRVREPRWQWRSRKGGKSKGGGKKGSFGRRFEVCTPRYDSYDESMWNASAAPYADDWAPTVWVPPPPCGCSGYSNKHGYGAHCKAWEEAIAPYPCLFE